MDTSQPVPLPSDAPFDREDPTLNPVAGACVTCPRRSGYNTSLFCDVQGDQCLDAPCYQLKVSTHIDREIAARPELVQIENGWRHAREQKSGAVQRGHFREIEAAAENPDAEPVPACAAAKTAIIVYGKRVGTTLTVCTDNNCPVHDPRATARQAVDPEPIMAPAPDAETDEEAEQRRAEHEQRRREYEAEQERRAEESRLAQEREDQEYEAEQARRHELRQAREATYDRILENAPAMFSAAQLRVLLRTIVNLDPYTFADDLAEDISAEGEHEADHRSAEEVLLSTLDNTADEKLTRFALRLALSGHRDIPRKDELDFLTEAEAVFPAPQPQKANSKGKTKKPTLVKAAANKAARKSLAA